TFLDADREAWTLRAQCGGGRA
ncbi:MAG: hypothetical protein FD126_1920, partial [Elusimicrobia bacterium]